MNDNIPPAPANAPSETALKVWLDYEATELLAREAELKAVLDHTPVHIDDFDEATAGAVSENLRMVVKLRSAAEKFHREQKDPWLKSGRVVDLWKTNFNSRLDQMIIIATNVVRDFMKRKDDRDRAELKRIADEKARIAEAAMKRDMFSEETVAAHREAEKAYEATRAPSAQVTHVEGQYGAKAALVTRWDFEVVDAKQAVMWWLAHTPPNDVKEAISATVKLAMKKRDKVTNEPTEQLPGIRWVKNETLGVR
jgi:hypothetical protein